MQVDVGEQGRDNATLGDAGVDIQPSAAGLDLPHLEPQQKHLTDRLLDAQITQLIQEYKMIN